jgi:hypothetical protein
MNPNYVVPTLPATMPIDQGQAAAAAVVMVVFSMIYMFFVLAFYVYLAVCLMKIAQKTGTPDEWWAWIPILNVLLMLKIAKKPLWWILLFLIPLVNIVIGIMVWMKIAEAVGKPSYWGIFMILPVVGLVAPGYLAFSKSEPTGGAPTAAQ